MPGHAVHTPDREDVFVVVQPLPPQPRGVPTCIQLHGLTGGSQETCIKVGVECWGRGRVVVCVGGGNRCRGCFH